MERIYHNLIFMILLGIDLYVIVTAPLIIAIIAFVIGITFLIRMTLMLNGDVHQIKKVK
ncbi:hypothetical protein COSHB9_22990 [Companilactobacillus alimentarius]|uniref:hypothetical protein n=1 Tax=Companilactobacillus alimentarius TaxID=1602 RepID=UPI0006EFBAFC|nr:hypothetical protein [Companilactobacillus alimentarius]KRK78287.1 hypothetical protein FC67_GL000856 [Companilactobacillus alimentarius DSM 20249]MDT6953310.1 hypothetical protein [Companilactobacillus alimentarius]GEO44559.1 hypothetical protein LAL01_07910 [Companilactobacillus alimentarius]